MRIRIAVVTAGLHPIHFPDEYFDVNTKKKKRGGFIINEPMSIGK